MIGALKWITARPSDKQIHIGNIVFGLILATATYYNLIYLGKTGENEFFWITIPNAQYIVIGILMLISAFSLLQGIGICLLKAKYVRIIQIIFSILLLYCSDKVGESATLDFDILLLVLGLFGLVFAITGKAITKKCHRYAQKIEKIRV